MPVPDYETLMLPLLRLFAEGQTNVASCLPQLRQEFQITDEEAAELIPSGRITVLQSRAHWARTYLSKAGLLESPRRNHHQITERGRDVLRSNPDRIDNAFLARFEDFSDWKDNSRRMIKEPGTASDGDVQPVPARYDDSQTPEDAMEAASSVLNAALREELLTLLFQMSPYRFEQVILDVLIAMGYGGGQISRSTLTSASGDGGIDGIIHEDALGLDAVFIQAKRYDVKRNVGRPDIQQFIGSLTGEGASKGVFVTTSDFSREAIEFLRRVQQRVVLINGQRLADLMIRHEVGVRTRHIYKLRSVDEDYFSDVDG